MVNKLGGSSPIEAAGPQRFLQKVAKLPGCAAAVKIFSDIFGLDKPASIKATPLTRQQSKTLHEGHKESPASLAKESVKSAGKSPPPQRHPAKLADYKKLLGDYEIMLKNNRLDHSALEKDLSEGGKLAQMRQELEKSCPDNGMFKSWNKVYDKLQDALGQHKTRLSQNGIPASAPIYQNYAVLDRLIPKLNEKVQAFLVEKNRQGSVKDVETAKEILTICQEFRQCLAQEQGREYDSLPPDKQLAIEQEIARRVGYPYEDIKKFAMK